MRHRLWQLGWVSAITAMLALLGAIIGAALVRSAGPPVADQPVTGPQMQQSEEPFPSPTETPRGTPPSAALENEAGPAELPAERDGPEAGEALWNRTFLSVSVNQGGVLRPLVPPGTRIRVSFERSADRAVVVWRASCNTAGGSVQVTPERLLVSEIHSTLIGCDPERSDQDGWLSDFFRADPLWELDGADLRLRSDEITIELVEERAG